MNFDELTRRIDQQDKEYVFLRPGISLCLLYSEPASTIGPAIAAILEEYVRFIQDGALQTYISNDGTWKPLTKRAYNALLGRLRGTRIGEYAEFHLGQEPLANVGHFGAHFSGSPLSNKTFHSEDCILYLEFPFDVSQFTTLAEFEAFVHRIAASLDFDSGYCGYAFKHLHLTFRRDAFKEIAKLALRYIGLDISNYLIRMDARHCVCNLSWLNLFGKQITAKLGGVDYIQSQLPETMSIIKIPSGILIRAAKTPIIGDVNRGAKDALVLRTLAELTKPVRLNVENIGPDAKDFAERWLSRFDSLK